MNTFPLPDRGSSMTTSKRVLHTVLVNLLGLIALTSALNAAPPDIKVIDQSIDDALQAWQVPGAAVVIIEGDRVVYLAGRGVRELGKPAPVTADTLFPLASCSKAFTTTLMAMLADDKRLAWDDPVRKHLKDFHLSDPLADGDVRLRDLVSHRTGVAGHDLLWYRAPWSQEEMVRRVGLLPLSQPFRTAMQYQTIMFIAAGQAASQSTGKSWAELVETRLFKPLDMSNACLTSEAALSKPDHAAAHLKNNDGVRVIPWYPMREPNAAGSVIASVRDLAPWLRLHLNEGMHGDVRLVSAANLKATHTPQIVIPLDQETQAMHPFTKQMSYGMAWVIQDYRGERLVSHAGLIDGFRAHVTLLPEKKIGLAILANLDQTRMNLALSNTIVDRLLGAPAKDWNAHYREIVEAQEFVARQRMVQAERQRKRNTRPTLALEQLAGTYEEPAYGVAKVHVDNGELVLNWSSFRARLEHWQDDTFRALDEDLGRDPILFHVADGKCTAMSAVGMKFIRK